MKTLAALLPLVLTVCGAVEVSRDDWQAQLVESYAEVEGPWPGSAQSYVGPYRLGGALTFRVTRVEGGAVTDDAPWTVRLEGPTSPEPMADRLSFWVKPDGEGQQQNYKADLFEGGLWIAPDDEMPERELAMFPLAALGQGMTGAPELFAGWEEGDPAPAGMESIGEHMIAVFALSILANESQAGRPLISELVQMPSWWTFLTLRFDLSMIPDFTRAVPVAYRDREAWGIPVEFRINGDPALYALLVAVEPEGALILSAGIVHAVAIAPDRPARIVQVELVHVPELPADAPALITFVEVVE